MLGVVYGYIVLYQSIGGSNFRCRHRTQLFVQEERRPLRLDGVGEAHHRLGAFISGHL